MVAKRQGGKGGKNWDQQMQTIIYTLDEQQGIWYRMGNYIQYLVINHNRKEYEDRIHICITESLGCIAEIKHNIVSQLYCNKIKTKYKVGFPGILHAL